MFANKAIGRVDICKVVSDQYTIHRYMYICRASVPFGGLPPQVGTLKVATSGYEPWRDYPVKRWRLNNLWSEHKITHDLYFEYAIGSHGVLRVRTFMLDVRQASAQIYPRHGDVNSTWVRRIRWTMSRSSQIFLACSQYREDNSRNAHLVSPTANFFKLTERHTPRPSPEP